MEESPQPAKAKSTIAEAITDNRRWPEPKTTRINRRYKLSATAPSSETKAKSYSESAAVVPA
jgi:hypothetical protein